MTRQRLRRQLFHLGQLAALATMAMLGLFDLQAGMASSSSVGWTAMVLTAMATAVVFLPEHRQGSVLLPRLALIVGGISILLTCALVVAGSGPTNSWGFAESTGLLATLFVVARRGEARWAVPAIIVVGFALTIGPMRSGHTDAFVILGLFLALCAAGAIGAGTYLRTIESGRERALATVRAEQRAEFARDLHDFIAHHVTGIVVQAQGAKFVAEQDPQRTLLALEQIEKAGAETMASMRRMVGVLRDPDASPDAPLAPLAGVAELAPLVEGFSSGGGPVARLHVDGALDGLPVEVSTSGYRVVMEALTNARQHAAHARAVDVYVSRTPDWLLVRVANDGVPTRLPAPRERPGYGLVGLGERVRAIGGRITAGPGVDGGWVVDVALPLVRIQ